MQGWERGLGGWLSTRALVRRARGEQMAGQSAKRLGRPAHDSEANVQVLAEAFEDNPAAVVILDLRFRVAYANLPFARMTGYDRDAMLGSDLAPLSRLVDGGRQAIDAALEQGRSWHAEVAHRRRDGRPFWVSTSVSGIRNECGVVTHYLVINEDISSFKRAVGPRPLSRRQQDAERGTQSGANGTVVAFALAVEAKRNAALQRSSEAGRRGGCPDSPGQCDDLSLRELEVLELLARGLTNRQVAVGLRLSARTVDHHVSHILTKLNVPNRTAAVFAAEQAGVFTSAESDR
jgi:PAS domain S-box-containing protein